MTDLSTSYIQDNSSLRVEKIRKSSFSSDNSIPWKIHNDSKLVSNFNNACKIVIARSSLVLNPKFAAGNVIEGKKIVDFYANNIYPSLSRENIVLLINSELVFPKDYSQVLYPVKEYSSFKDGRSLYRIIQDQYAEWAYDPSILNFSEDGAKNVQGFQPAHAFFFEDPKLMTRETVMSVMSQLESCISFIRKNFMTVDGQNLAYDDLFASEFFKDEFLSIMHHLAYLPIEVIKADTNSVIAFFINVYNAMNIHCIYNMFRMKIWPEVGFTQRVKFYNNFRYLIGGQIYSPNDIEHGILRGNNSLGMSSLELVMFKLLHSEPSEKRFSNLDNRMKFVIKRSDPRIHFALWNCTQSCGVLRSYNGSELDKQLELAAKDFCLREVFFSEYSTGNRIKVTMSQVFSWYTKDFGPEKLDALKFALEFFPAETQNLVNLYIDQRQQSIKLRYSDYNWELNRMEIAPKEEISVQKRP